MDNFGKIFKTIRKARNLSLEEATGGAFSVSMLSRFENGQTEISAQKLRVCLENVYLGLMEFDFMVEEFQPSEMARLELRCRQLLEVKDKEGLLALSKEQKDLAEKEVKKQFHRLNSIWIKAKIRQIDDNFALPEDDINFMTDYLFSTDYWSRYELQLFMATTSFFPSDVYLSYCREMLQRSSFFKEDIINNNYIHTILMNGLFATIEREDFFEAGIFIKLLREHFSGTRDAYMRIVELIAVGFYEAKKGQPEGLDKIKKGLAIFEDLGYLQEASYYSQVLDELD